MRQIAIALILALLLAYGCVLLPGRAPGACTAEAKICPDGSAVGRVGPNCEFAPCPPIGLNASLKGFATNLEWQTRNNTDFRRVLYTGQNSQLVLMSLLPGEEIGAEVHPGRDQFFRFEGGEGEVFINKVAHPVHDGDAVIVPAGALHNVVDTSNRTSLKFYTIYSPPEHIDQTVRHTKADAVAMPEEYDGRPTEYH